MQFHVYVCAITVFGVAAVTADEPSAKTGCGRPTIKPRLNGRSGPTSLIYNGDEARKNSWPWHILVVITDPNQSGHNTICGGTVIEEHFVLTAAHCFHKLVKANKTRKADAPKYVKVWFGAHDMQDRGEGRTKKYISQLFICPQYNSTTNEDDIALLGFNDPIKFTDHVQPICLPKRNVPVNTEAYVVGWGLNKNGKVMRKLQQAMQKIGDAHSCADAVKKWQNAAQKQDAVSNLEHYLNRRMICGVRQTSRYATHCKVLCVVC